MSVEIARCPEHGLHGERAECFVCGGPVEQVRMVPVTEIVVALRNLDDAWVRVGDLDVEYPTPAEYVERQFGGPATPAKTNKRGPDA